MKIFLSYANEDKTIAERVARTLRNDKHEVFYSEDSLTGSDAYSTLIRQAIDSSEFFVFLISPASVKDGSYTLTELRFAEAKWKSPSGFVLPVEIRPTPYGKVPSYLSTLTIWKAVGNLEAELAAEVARFAKPRDKVSIPGSSGRTVLIAGGCLTLGAAIGLYPTYACVLGLPGCKPWDSSVAIVSVKCIPKTTDARSRYVPKSAFVLVKGNYDTSDAAAQIARLKDVAGTSEIDPKAIKQNPRFAKIREKLPKDDDKRKWMVLEQPLAPEQVEFPLPKLDPKQSAHFFIEIENIAGTELGLADSSIAGIRELANLSLEEDTKTDDLGIFEGIAPLVTKVDLFLNEGEILCWENAPPE